MGRSGDVRATLTHGFGRSGVPQMVPISKNIDLLIYTHRTCKGSDTPLADAQANLLHVFMIYVVMLLTPKQVLL